MRGQRIAIHAAKTIDKDYAKEFDYSDPDSLPLGAVVAVATLKDVYQVRALMMKDDFSQVAWCINAYDYRNPPVANIEIPVDDYGNFGLRRYLWQFTDIVALDEPVPARGYQKIWEWNE